MHPAAPRSTVRPSGRRPVITASRESDAGTRISILVAIVCLLALVSMGWSADFYVSPTGNDANSGTSATLPWQTITKVNGRAFSAGDRILFQGGQSFAGSLSFDASDAGTATSPVVVGSYGTGRAIIAAASGNAVYVYNGGGFEVRDLILTGAGRTTSTSTGVSFYMDLAGGVKLSHLVIDNIDASGFRQGIDIGSWHSSLSGYIDVRVTNCVCHDNARGGMGAWGFNTSTTGVWSHRDWYVGHCTFFGNTGDPAYTQNHSGNGIVVGEVDNITIERCVAHDNGTLSAHLGGGPVGIWAYDSNRVTIQLCESHHNHCGQSVDGGGFDLDGGSTNSVMQYNWSHDNDGAGYLVGDYSGSRPTATNTVRYNVSQNDGRKNSYAGVYVYAGSDCRVFGNTLYTTPSANGSPACVRVTGGAGTRVWNNILISANGAQIIDCASSTTLQGNDYWSSGATFAATYNGVTYASLTAMRAAGVERLNGADVGKSVDPLLVSPGNGITFDNADAIGGLDAYKLQAASTMIDAGLDLAAAFTVQVGTRDYFGNSLPQRTAFDIGAHELPPTAIAAPVISSGGTASGTVGVAFTYAITANGSPTGYGASGLPAGLSVNTGSGAISGTPSASGTFTVTLSATNAGGTGTKTLTLTIASAMVAPVISSPGTASGTVGVAFSYAITASGSPTSYGASGLPAGLSVNTGSGAISGTPSALGAFTVTLSATNAGGTGTKTLTLTIASATVAPVISSPGTASGTVGVAFSYAITASGSPTGYGASGLPAGLSVNSGSGAISGTPSASGSFTVTLSATNSGGTGTKTLTLTIAVATPSPSAQPPPTVEGGHPQTHCGIGSGFAILLVACCFWLRSR